MVVAHSLVPREDLHIRFETYIERITAVAAGESPANSVRITAYFQKGFSSHVPLDRKKDGTGACYPSKIALRSYSEVIPELSCEDIKQQVILYLYELWNYLRPRWSSYHQNSFKSHVESKVSSWIGKWVASKVMSYWAGLKADSPEQFDYIQEELPVELNLGWTLLQEKYGLFRGLSVKQKYMLYLRFSRDMTAVQISDLIGMCIDKVNKEFMVINRILKENHYGRAETRN